MDSWFFKLSLLLVFKFASWRSASSAHVFSAWFAVTLQWNTLFFASFSSSCCFCVSSYSSRDELWVLLGGPSASNFRVVAFTSVDVLSSEATSQAELYDRRNPAAVRWCTVHCIVRWYAVSLFPSTAYFYSWCDQNTLRRSLSVDSLHISLRTSSDEERYISHELIAPREPQSGIVGAHAHDSELKIRMDQIEREAEETFVEKRRALRSFSRGFERRSRIIWYYCIWIQGAWKSRYHQLNLVELFLLCNMELTIDQYSTQMSCAESVRFGSVKLNLFREHNHRSRMFLAVVHMRSGSRCTMVVWRICCATSLWRKQDVGSFVRQIFDRR